VADGGRGRGWFEFKYNSTSGTPEKMCGLQYSSSSQVCPPLLLSSVRINQVGWLLACAVLLDCCSLTATFKLKRSARSPGPRRLPFVMCPPLAHGQR